MTTSANNSQQASATKQRSLLSFFKAPAKQELPSNQTIANPLKVDSKEFSTEKLDINANVSIPTTPKKKQKLDNKQPEQLSSPFFNSFSSKTKISSNSETFQLSQNSSFTFAEKDSPSASKSSVLPKKRKESVSSLFEDSEGMDFEVDDSLLEQLGYIENQGKEPAEIAINNPANSKHENEIKQINDDEFTEQETESELRNKKIFDSDDDEIEALAEQESSSNSKGSSSFFLKNSISGYSFSSINSNSSQDTNSSSSKLINRIEKYALSKNTLPGSSFSSDGSSMKLIDKLDKNNKALPAASSSSQNDTSSKNQTSALSDFAFNADRPHQATLLERKPQKQYEFLVDKKHERMLEFRDRNRERYKWLVDIKDENGFSPSNPNYNPRTLYIPKSAWSGFTPFELQYWEIKSKNWDTVVFFKKGKFYELYENDADIGHQFFDLKLTDRVNMRMVGVPELSFEYWASQFVAKGYKVAKVEQMESSLAKTIRERDEKEPFAGNNSSKKIADKLNKVVRRELTCVLTAGTLVDPKMLAGDLATYCLAIVETDNLVGTSTSSNCDSETFFSGSGPCYGIAFCDTATAKFFVTSIQNDDVNRTQLETLLMQINPREVVFVNGGAGSLSFKESNSDSSNVPTKRFGPLMDIGDGMSGLTPASWKILKGTCGISTIWNKLQPVTEFWNFKKSLEEIKSEKYFDLGNCNGNGNGEIKYPKALLDLENIPIGKLVYTALGGLVSYLRSLNMDKDLLPVGNFESYSPLRAKLNLVVDGATLSNLDIFSVGGQNSLGHDTAQEGSIFSLLNHTLTAFGSRLIYQWVCHPLCDANQINSRLDVVEFYRAKRHSELVQKITSTLSGLPDLERILSRIHSGTCRIPEWMKVLSSFYGLSKDFTEMREIIESYTGDMADLVPAKIKSLVFSFPKDQVLSALDEISSNFDHEKADSENNLVPISGKYPRVDELSSQISEIEEWLNDHLSWHRKQYKCKSIVYKSIGKETFQLEIPKSIRVPDNYIRKSATKDLHRYYSPELAKKLAIQAELLELMKAELRDYKLVLYKKFADDYRLWMKVIMLVSELDALMSLARASEMIGVDSTRPEFLVDRNVVKEGGYFEFKGLRHPCLVNMTGSGDFGSTGFVPNDVVLGKKGIMSESHGNKGYKDIYDDASVILLSGPNMGGKSTLIRQVCVAIILAQIGAYIPANSAKLTVFDRIFTRLGARDNLLMGRSTFMVEMAETSSFLKLATKASFVAVDELGRGTATHDGTAIAYSVLHSLSSRMGCLSIFSTHYGLLAHDLCFQDSNSEIDRKEVAFSSIIDKFAGKSGVKSPHIRPMRMACMVNQEAHKVTFLYKLENGIAEQSHGMNVAHMAGVPLSVVERASIVAENQFGLQGQTPLFKGHETESLLDNEQKKNVLPISFLSDFANLIRVSRLKIDSDKLIKDRTNKGNQTMGQRNIESNTMMDDKFTSDGVFSVTAIESNAEYENQSFSCIVDHLKKSILSEN
ncbi:hypothetical protein BB560_000402 [Smittium megazygosporum]|uniref:DNA mismatch repair protein n=1 Tax=Smittium megazygosporum TaxID=133381 RepID=A0A2T9ZKF9_9FUNG|nr:hypothetical protein BB560_000402 [Smittium megazygosporum]